MKIIPDVDNKLSDITNFNQKIDFVEDAGNIKLKIEWEASDKDGNKVIRTFEVITNTEQNKELEYKVEKPKSDGN